MPAVQSNEEVAAIRAIEAAYDAAWAAADLDGLLACLADDAVLLNPRGNTLRGHLQIRRELESVLRGFDRSTHESKIHEVSLLTPDVAVVDGEARVTGRVPPERAFSHRFTDILVKRSDRWLIAHVRA